MNNKQLTHKLLQEYEDALRTQDYHQKKYAKLVTAAHEALMEYNGAKSKTTDALLALELALKAKYKR